MPPSQISIFNCSLYEKYLWFLYIDLYLRALLNSLISYKISLILFLGIFCTENLALFLSLQLRCLRCLFVAWLPQLGPPGQYKMHMVSKGICGLFLIFREIILHPALKCDVSPGFLLDSLYQVEEVSSMPSLQRIFVCFIMNKY